MQQPEKDRQRARRRARVSHTFPALSTTVDEIFVEVRLDAGRIVALTLSAV